VEINGGKESTEREEEKREKERESCASTGFQKSGPMYVERQLMVLYSSQTGMRIAEALLSCGTPTATPGLENLGLQTPTLALRNLDSDSGPKNRHLTPTLGLIV